MPSLEFLVGLLESEAHASAAWEDFRGPHGMALRLWQDMGFLDREPVRNPAPGCPHCDEGVPYLTGERYLCNRCFGTVDRRYLLLWSLNREAFVCWLGRELRLRGQPRQVDDCLWQL